MNKSLCFYYQNCRGLRTKLHTIYMNILAHNYDIIILTETWLHLDIPDSDVVDSRYNIFRSDRDRSRSGKQDGGGVLVAVRCGLAAFAATIPTKYNLGTFEHLVIYLSTASKKKYVLSAAYLPPNSHPETYETHFEYLHSILNDGVSDFWLLGDYNLPHLQWDQVGQPIIVPNDCLPHKQLIDLMSVFNCS